MRLMQAQPRPRSASRSHFPTVCRQEHTLGGSTHHRHQEFGTWVGIAALSDNEGGASDPQGDIPLNPMDSLFSKRLTTCLENGVWTPVVEGYGGQDRKIKYGTELLVSGCSPLPPVGSKPEEQVADPLSGSGLPKHGATDRGGT